MAKVRGPLMSVDARGALGSLLLFRGGKHGTRVYRPADPAKVNQRPPTDAQDEIRGYYGDTVQEWRELDQQTRDDWNAKAAADPRAVTGWNLFVQDRMRARQEPEGMPPDSYQPPPGNAIDFPGYAWVADYPYTPPPGNAIV